MWGFRGGVVSVGGNFGGDELAWQQACGQDRNFCHMD